MLPRRRSLRMLLATLLGLAVLPLLNGWLVTPPPGAACCSVERWFSSEPLLRVASAAGGRCDEPLLRSMLPLPATHLAEQLKALIAAGFLLRSAK